MQNDESLNYVGIFKLNYPLLSEQFISEQVRVFQSFKPFFLLKEKMGPLEYPYIALSENDLFKLRQKWMVLTKSPQFFIRNCLVQKVQLIHAHFGLDAVYALEVSKSLGVPLITTFHGYDITSSDEQILDSCGFAGRHYLRGRNRLKEEGALFLAVSKFVKQKLILAGYPINKIRVHYIGVDVDKFSPISKVNHCRYVLNIGRHVDVKGLDVLIKAFAVVSQKHRDVQLIQVGSGPLSDNLVNLASELGVLNRVNFTGSLPQSSVVKLIQEAEVFAFSSNRVDSGAEEAFGLVLNEASACGIPVVATISGGVPEAVIDGETGYLVPERDVKLFADKLDALLSNSSRARAMGQSGREFVLDSFNIRKQSATLEELYRQVICDG